MGNILVVAAHPDDEVLGCGGTIPQLVKNGNDVYVCILGEGIASRYEARDRKVQREIELLRDRGRKACEILGVKEVFFDNLPDNRFDTVALLDIIRIIEKIIAEIQPDTVYTHHHNDLNIDHSITSQATITATRPIGKMPVKEVYAYEILSSTEWSFGNTKSSFSPNTFVGIEKTLDTKNNALLCYQSEIRDFPHPRSIEAVTTAAKRWGAICGYKAAEAFELIRAIR
ncbi:MAG: PIG-L deacetylase family protein [Candidatus Scalindua sp.]